MTKLNPLDVNTPEEMFTNWEVILRYVSKSVERGGKILRVLMVSFLLDILLTVGIGYDTVHLHTLTQQQAVATCVSGNRAREDNRHLWDYVLNLIDKNGKPSQAVLGFEKYLNKATAQRDCKL
jgi:hypothetical protein